MGSVHIYQSCMALVLLCCRFEVDQLQGGMVSARARVSWEGGRSIDVVLWFSAFLVRGPWPKHYDYHGVLFYMFNNNNTG